MFNQPRQSPYDADFSRPRAINPFSTRNTPQNTFNSQPAPSGAATVITPPISAGSSATAKFGPKPVSAEAPLTPGSRFQSATSNFPATDSRYKPLVGRTIFAPKPSSLDSSPFSSPSTSPSAPGGSSGVSTSNPTSAPPVPPSGSAGPGPAPVPHHSRVAAPAMSTPAWFDSVSAAYLSHSSASRVNTDLHTARSLRSAFPEKYLAVVPQQTCDLLSFADSGHATFAVYKADGASSVQSSFDVQDAKLLPKASQTLSHRWKVYVEPEQRLDGQTGKLAEDVIFDRFTYTWNGVDFTLFLVDGRDGSGAYPAQRTAYLLGSDREVTDALVLAAAQFQNEVHDAVLIFENGGWTRSKALYESVMRAEWSAVILEEKMKAALMEDHEAFFDGRDRYKELGVPWKRGVIYYGPPGNGKTISIKAMMHTLYARAKPIPTVYVRNLVTWSGPEEAIKEVFSMARRHAPCYLIFEDIDSLITDGVRSYFLNEVDGLKSNDGIFMLASTNHLDRLDPGISQRPSRFDRKYLFPNPNEAQRALYCKYWQRKVGGSSSNEVDFPDALCRAVAGITKGFSYAYMQEAFVAALMTIARRGDEAGVFNEEAGDDEARVLEDRMQAVSVGDASDEDDGWVDVLKDHNRKHKNKPNDDEDESLKKNVLWREMQKQVKILRESMKPDNME
ncbi:hypothetical protein TD95_003399 [Thielaviopsis punctulata]|uniref:ATPase AAA-type core domain-containing protein n=1 Tax=Thielaviopsis punctulata TaxID=72032 RepID=A0A0F4ZG11_9PEZI|nr:hypothetical protein TD95_003399 [Thielaviopsis punctulata]